MRYSKEQKLLKTLYDAQEQMEHLLSKGKEDEHYEMITALIKRLEIFLQTKQDLL